MSVAAALKLSAAPVPAGLADRPDPAAFGATIVTPRKEIEQAFLAMGGGLVAAARLLDTISGAHLSMAHEFEGEDFLSAVQGIASLRTEVAALIEGISAGGSEFTELAETTRELRVPLEETENAIRFLELVAVNARIVAAAIGVTQTDMITFTDEMVQISRGAKQAVASITDVQSRVSKTVAATLKLQSDFSKEHAQTMAAISLRLDEHLAVIDKQRVQAAEHAKRSAAMTAGIGARIGDAVAAMQVGDGTRQRLEHVEAILGQIADHGGRWTDDTEPVLWQLAAAQLSSTNEDYLDEIGTLLAALDSLRGDAGQVLRDGTDRARRTLADSSAALSALAADMNSLGPLLRKEVENRTTARKLSESAADAMQQMLAQINLLERIEREVWLLGLNMAIRCSSLGDQASGLRVIAKELGGLAKKTSVAASRVRRILGGAQAAIEEARRRAARFDGKDLTDAPMAAARRLEAALAQLAANKTLLSTACPEAATHLDGTARRARETASRGHEWAGLATEIAAAAGARETMRADEAVLVGIRKSYTMHKERQIHDQISGAAPEPLHEGAAGHSAPPDSAAGAADDIDAFLF
jgi:hypothetical protein